MDSLIARVADSLIAEIPSDDTDEQYFDTSVIINDTLILSIIRDGEPAHRIPLTGLLGDHDWYEVGTTTAPNNIDDNKWTGTGAIGIGINTNTEYALHIKFDPEYPSQYYTGEDFCAKRWQFKLAVITGFKEHKQHRPVRWIVVSILL